MFAIVTDVRGSTEFRWRLADDDGGQSALFAEEELVHRHVGIGAYRGLEFLHVRAKQIITAVPDASRVPFRHTINAYRGCSHACTYCFARPTHEYLGLAYRWRGRSEPAAPTRVGFKGCPRARRGGASFGVGEPMRAVDAGDSQVQGACTPGQEATPMKTRAA